MKKILENVWARVFGAVLFVALAAALGRKYFGKGKKK